jgi:catechol 2,3-dioxygenase-like lactoylglutathione lyase family enzyme
MGFDIAGIHHVTFNVTDLDRARDFYEGVLGLEKDHDLGGREDDGFREMAIAAERALVAGGLVQPHSRDLSTATSGNSSGEP